MKKISFLLPMIALVIGISTSAFTNVKNLDSDLVWFKTSDSGTITSQGVQGDEPPSSMNCPGTTYLCAAAFSISAGQVQLVNGQYQLNSGVTVNDRIDQREHD